jgi:hypothetical protein
MVLVASESVELRLDDPGHRSMPLRRAAVLASGDAS